MAWFNAARNRMEQIMTVKLEAGKKYLDSHGIFWVYVGENLLNKKNHAIFTDGYGENPCCMDDEFINDLREYIDAPKERMRRGFYASIYKTELCEYTLNNSRQADNFLIRHRLVAKKWISIDFEEGEGL
jgi:hypothetical protein